MPSEQPREGTRDQPHTGRPRDASHPDAGQWGHPSQRPSVFDSVPASPPHTGEARVDSDTLHAIAQNAYNRALAPRDATCDPNDAMHEAVDAVLDALHEPAQPQPRGEGDDLTARGEWDRAERIAQDFHETYERLAPNHAYRTRPESAVPWSEVPPANKALMIATVQEVLARASTHPEQSARVSEDDLYVLTKFQRIMRSANRQHEVEAVDRILAALEPASTPEPEDSDA